MFVESTENEFAVGGVPEERNRRCDWNSRIVSPGSTGSRFSVTAGWISLFFGRQPHWRRGLRTFLFVRQFEGRGRGTRNPH